MSQSSNELAITDIVTSRCNAITEANVEGIVANVADDVVIFDVVGGMVSKGRQAAITRATEWLASYNGAPKWNVEDLHVVAGDEVAFCHCLSRVQGQLKSGDDIDMWFRTTLGFQKLKERWQIVHDHSSDPFDPNTGLATMGKPEQLP